MGRFDVVRQQRGVALAAAWVSCGLGVLAGAGCPKVASCTGPEDCDEGYRCDPDRGACVKDDPGDGGSATSGTSSWESSTLPPSSAAGSSSSSVSSSQGSSSRGSSVGSGSSRGTSTSSLAPSSASGSSAGGASSGPVDAGLPCPARCAARADGGHVESWWCDDAGACRASRCQAGWADCDDAGVTCDTDTTTSLTHCGGCGLDETANTSANACHGGHPVCDPVEETCAPSTPYCVPMTVLPCRECVGDADCPSSRRACCGGTCVEEGSACGCSREPGGHPGAVCDPAHTGGACVGAHGDVLAVGGLLWDGGTAETLHGGVCGCPHADGRPVAETATCASRGGFLGLCAPTGHDGGAGRCVAQNDPPRDAGQPAYNCGVLGVTCNPSLGGLDCRAEEGVGHCGCRPVAGEGPEDCRVPVFDTQGRPHQAADDCPWTGGCTCAGGGPCAPNSATPDCCASGCTNLLEDAQNCGACGVTTANHPGTDRCVGGQRLCGTLGWPCPQATPYCLANGPAVGCYECTSNADCAGNTERPFCCRGMCSRPSLACGCALEPSGRAGTVCLANQEGGACVAPDGTVMAVGDTKYGQSPPIQEGVCGCGRFNDGWAYYPEVCPWDGGFQMMCGPSPDGGRTGACTPQNSPPRNGDTPAGQCGGLDATCNPERGGFTCVPDGGMGRCHCNPNTVDHCDDPVRDQSGNPHRVALSCPAQGRCACWMSGSTPVRCEANGTTPDCCPGSPGTCTNLRTTRTHCGACGVSCATSRPCVGAACTCGTAADCPAGGQGGGTACPSGTCVCPSNSDTSCGVGEWCCNGDAGAGHAFGCCTDVCNDPLSTLHQCRSELCPGQVTCLGVKTVFPTTSHGYWCCAAGKTCGARGVCL